VDPGKGSHGSNAQIFSARPCVSDREPLSIGSCQVKMNNLPATSWSEQVRCLWDEDDDARFVL